MKTFLITKDIMTYPAPGRSLRVRKTFEVRAVDEAAALREAKNNLPGKHARIVGTSTP